MSKLVSKEKYQDKTSKLLMETAKHLSEGFFGLASSDRKDLILSLGYIFQRTRSVGFLKALFQEWNAYRAKGRIKDDYIESEQHQECLQEILDFLDLDSPDSLRFKMLKAIFLGASTETLSDRESVLPQQYMSLCRTFSAGEALVLQATFSTYKSGAWSSTDKAGDWLDVISKKSGLMSRELVEIHERKLINKNILNVKYGYAKDRVTVNSSYRLTPLAIGICEFIQKFEVETPE